MDIGWSQMCYSASLIPRPSCPSVCRLQY